jgi:hypothetical protein
VNLSYFVKQFSLKLCLFLMRVTFNRKCNSWNNSYRPHVFTDTIFGYVSIERECLANVKGAISSEFQEVIFQVLFRLCKMLITACHVDVYTLIFHWASSIHIVWKWGSLESTLLKFQWITVTSIYVYVCVFPNILKMSLLKILALVT